MKHHNIRFVLDHSITYLIFLLLNLITLLIFLDISKLTLIFNFNLLYSLIMDHPYHTDLPHGVLVSDNEVNLVSRT